MYDKLSGTESTKLGNSIVANDAMNWMADQIEAGNVSWMDITDAGKLSNPKANLMFQSIKEYYARPLSGAAINAKEWKQFATELGLTKIFLGTPEGNKATVAKLRELSANNKRIGRGVTRDDNWMDNMRSWGEESESKADTGARDFGKEYDF